LFSSIHLLPSVLSANHLGRCHCKILVLLLLLLLLLPGMAMAAAAAMLLAVLLLLPPLQPAGTGAAAAALRLVCCGARPLLQFHLSCCQKHQKILSSQRLTL
jgi:hypothetical protein